MRAAPPGTGLRDAGGGADGHTGVCVAWRSDEDNRHHRLPLRCCCVVWRTPRTIASRTPRTIRVPDNRAPESHGLLAEGVHFGWADVLRVDPVALTSKVTAGRDA